MLQKHWLVPILWPSAADRPSILLLNWSRNTFLYLKHTWGNFKGFSLKNTVKSSGILNHNRYFVHWSSGPSVWNNVGLCNVFQGKWGFFSKNCHLSCDGVQGYKQGLFCYEWDQRGGFLQPASLNSPRTSPRSVFAHFPTNGGHCD